MYPELSMSGKGCFALCAFMCIGEGRHVRAEECFLFWRGGWYHYSPFPSSEYGGIQGEEVFFFLLICKDFKEFVSIWLKKFIRFLVVFAPEFHIILELFCPGGSVFGNSPIQNRGLQ